MCPADVPLTHSALGPLSPIQAQAQILIVDPVLPTMTAPTIDHRGSCDSVPLLQTAYGGGYHHGLSEFVLTDRTLPNHAVAASAMARDNLAPYGTGHLTRSSRDSHELHASIPDPQSTSGPLDHRPFGSGSSQGQASVYSNRKPMERHCQTRMNSADTSIYPKIPDEHYYIDVPHLQTHQPSWYPPRLSGTLGSAAL
ncbi:hypothetical protein NXS19_003586 [Fusarium pseudograminearum]|nr:hypothetical protein NXS19_003586 [Fusarium pseudograminearum]